MGRRGKLFQTDRSEIGAREKLKEFSAIMTCNIPHFQSQNDDDKITARRRTHRSNLFNNTYMIALKMELN
jgi:hypothetical protein